MKIKRFVAMLIATGMLVCSVCGCGNSSNDANTNQLNNVSSGEDNIGNGEQLTPVQQIKLIVDCAEQWYVEPNDNWINYVGVSDFDDNGRMEVTVSREEAGSYVTTQFYMYEINEDGNGLTKISVDVGDEDYMPDISLNNMLNCYKASDGSLCYAVTDCNMSDYSTYRYSNFLMKLENGSLKFSKYSSMVCNFADNSTPELYYGADGESITAETYAGAEENIVKSTFGECEKMYQMMGFRSYDSSSDISELLNASYEKVARLNQDEYDTYLSESRIDSGAASLGLSGIGSLYNADIDDDYLRNKVWTSFYVFNYETGEEFDYLRNGGEGSRFEKEMIFFGNDGTGYYIDCDGNRTDFSWCSKDSGMAEAVVNGETYQNAVFGYTLVDDEGNEHQAIAFEFRNEYIYSMCE